MTTAAEQPQLDRVEPFARVGVSWTKIAVWLVALGLACLLDRPVAAWVSAHGIDTFMDDHAWVRLPLKSPGEYWLTIVAMGAVLLRFARWQEATLVFVATTLSGINGLTKWVAGRYRPWRWNKDHIDQLRPFNFDVFSGGWDGLRGASKNLSFPSGHAALAFASAAALGILFPRYRPAFYVAAGICGLERIAENAHWCSDVVAAAALGIGGVWLVCRVWWGNVQASDLPLLLKKSPNG